jgi:hypothetical protein
MLQAAVAPALFMARVGAVPERASWRDTIRELSISTPVLQGKTWGVSRRRAEEQDEVKKREPKR